MPPCRAIAIAISASVTVSIADESSGIVSGRYRVNRVLTSTLRGWIFEC